MKSITFAEAAQRMLADMRAAHEPAKAATFRATESRLRTINEALGAVRLGEIKGITVKRYLDARVASGKSGSTVNGEYQIIRKVISSVVDANLNCVYPIKWEKRNLELPSVKPAEDRVLDTPQDEIEKAVAAELFPFSPLVGFLAFSGLRLGEAVACRIGTATQAVTHWDFEASQIRVKTAYDFEEHGTKTGFNQVVDLCSEANEYLMSCVGDRSEGFLFTRDGGPLERNWLYRAARKFHGSLYHGLRRARISHLYKCMTEPAQEQIIEFWSGHAAGKTQTQKYSRACRDAAWRREFAESAGIGFSLPSRQAETSALEVAEVSA